MRDTASYLISDECYNSASNYDRYCLGPNGARCSAVARLDPRVHIIGKTRHACTVQSSHQFSYIYRHQLRCMYCMCITAKQSKIQYSVLSFRRCMVPQTEGVTDRSVAIIMQFRPLYGPFQQCLFYIGGELQQIWRRKIFEDTIQLQLIY